MTDYATLRRTMVDTQVRPSDVTEFPIIDAMLRVPRERFVPAGMEGAAYLGENLPLGPGRVMFEPRTLAKALDALNVSPSDLALVVGAGTGYAAAVMARLAGTVVALEEDDDLAAEAEAALGETGAESVVIERGPLADGAPAHAPYDVILIEGAVARIPDALAGQLREDGRIAALFDDGRFGEMRVGRGAGGGRIDWRGAFNAGAPLLHGFEAPQTFRL